MKASRRTAVFVGIFYIIGTGAGILSMVFLGPFMEAPEYLNSIAANESKVVLGTLLILTMGFALTMVPVLLFPIFRRYNEALAMGAVVFRGALEAVVYMVQAVIWLMLLSLSQEIGAAGTLDAPNFSYLGTLLMRADAWMAYLLSIVFSLGALMIYWVFYQSKLIPRWLSGWGLLGGLLYLISAVVGFFGMDWGFLMLPLAVQEMALALWLIIKGFNSNEIDALAEKQI